MVDERDGDVGIADGRPRERDASHLRRQRGGGRGGVGAWACSPAATAATRVPEVNDDEEGLADERVVVAREQPVPQPERVEHGEEGAVLRARGAAAAA